MNHQELLNKIAEYRKEHYDPNVFGIGYGFKNVNGVDTEERAIVFNVKKKKPKDKLKDEEIIPNEFTIGEESIKTDVQQRSRAQLLVCETFPYPGYTNGNSVRPLRGGVSTGFDESYGNYGTLGCLAVDNDTNTLVALSNSHVWVKDASTTYERDNADLIESNENSFLKQNVDNTDYIGRIKKYKCMRYYKDGDAPPHFVNYMDVAVYAVDAAAVDSNSWKMEGLLSANNTPYDFATTAEIDAMDSNTLFYSSGAASGPKGEGTTKLRLYSFPTIVNIGGYIRQNPGYLNRVYSEFHDIIAFCATETATPPFELCGTCIIVGDSGSALLADINGTVKIVGIIFAGLRVNEGSANLDVGYACRIDRIAADLNLSAYTGQSVGFANRDNPEFVYGLGKSLDDYVDIGEKRYWQMGMTMRIPT